MAPRTLNRLNALSAKSLPAGKHSDGGGVWLFKTGTKSGKWVFRFTIHGRRREMGLGAYPEVSLAEARQKAEQARALIRNDQDPIKARQNAKREAIRNLHILSDIAQDAFDSRKAELKGDGKAGRWFSPLEIHILPKLGKLPVSDIDQIDIRDCIAPIWHTKAETAKKALNRLNICLRHAAALGLEVDLQAPEKARALLGKSKHKVKHIASLPWQDVPDFFHSLEEDTITHLALKLLILTGLRSKPIRFIHEGQIVGDIWTVPGDLMKGREGQTADFRVPLVPEMLDIIDRARPQSRDGYLFPNVRKGVISDATMSRFMERRGLEARPHGFRSSLRNWLSEQTDAPHDVAEAMIAHFPGSKVEKAYKRTDFLDQRRELHEKWAMFISNYSEFR